MKTGFTSGIIIGGIISAAMYSMINGDMDIKRTKKRIMRMGRDVCRRSRRIMSDISNMVH